jgi:hypothetical protein
MLANEAAWLEHELGQLARDQLDPLLSVGSGAAYAREVLQPWIAERVFAPLQRRGVHVIHQEYAPGPGIEVAGDLTDPSFGEQLRRLGARSVLCCNVLEHIADRRLVAAQLEALVPPGGFLVLTVPRRFPYHPDPIDTMYRPSVAELVADFPALELERGAEVPCGTLFSYLRQTGSLRRSLANGVRVAISRVRRGDAAAEDAEDPAAAAHPGSRARSGALLYLVRSTAVTCAILRRSSS